MKKKAVILSIGFSIIAVTIVLALIDMNKGIAEASDYFDRILVPPLMFAFSMPVILQELLLLRSVYKLTFNNPSVATKICCVIASVVSLAVIVFVILYMTEVIRPSAFFSSDSGIDGNRLAVLVLCTAWPSV
ncbi:MAG: hypothetical protein J6V01_04455, partial [Clostridia bacterium]|nr:hypothetical protein [Clostridia bacterium]